MYVIAPVFQIVRDQVLLSPVHSAFRYRQIGTIFQLSVLVNSRLKAYPGSFIELLLTSTLAFLVRPWNMSGTYLGLVTRHAIEARNVTSIFIGREKRK
jgi:hypothetical protein